MDGMTFPDIWSRQDRALTEGAGRFHGWLAVMVFRARGSLW